jgi:hypothetical protein
METFFWYYLETNFGYFFLSLEHKVYKRAGLRGGRGGCGCDNYLCEDMTTIEEKEGRSNLDFIIIMFVNRM